MFILPITFNTDSVETGPLQGDSFLADTVLLTFGERIEAVVPAT